MIILYHNDSIITEIFSTEGNDFSGEINKNIIEILFKLSNRFEDEILVWCDRNEKDNLNVAEIQSLFHHNKFMFSYNSSPDNFFDRRLGYIEDSPYIKINKEVRYATWQMCSQVGALHSSVINACKNDLNAEKSFDYFLNSFAKRAITSGLFCYSEPRLLLNRTEKLSNKRANLQELFKFTKQHYKTRWVLLLLINLFFYEKKIVILPFLSSFFYKKRTFNPSRLDSISLESSKKIIEAGTIDVLIPTIGRKTYLLDVLNNLASQTYLPTNIIIIEQNPLENSTSELDYIHNKNWPFVIKHHFTNQPGACNARNIGLDMVESEFTFFADDDIVFENNLLQNVIQSFKSIGNEVLLVSIHLASEEIIPQSPRQFSPFGTCHAFVKTNCIRGLKFNMGLEFGYGEDYDFGMQIKERGFDFIYLSTFKILHLKAPMGGFRTKPVLKWHNQKIQPKPSPTIMLVRLTYETTEQIRSFKTTLFLKNLNRNFFKNPSRYIKLFEEKWHASIYWANKLDEIKE
ncbi:glycosyltransferase family 2 protein [Flavobacterium sp.]